MTAADYLRQKAAELRDMAADNPDAEASEKLLALAEHCEKLANEMQGNDHAGTEDE